MLDGRDIAMTVMAEFLRIWKCCFPERLASSEQNLRSWESIATEMGSLMSGCGSEVLVCDGVMTDAFNNLLVEG